VYYTVSGTATSGSDYIALPGSVTIAAGSSTATITVTPIDDTIVESDETVIVTLSTNAAYTVGSPSNATVTISSDDVGETVSPPTTPSLGSGGLFMTFSKSSKGDSNLYTGTSYKFSTGGSSSSAGSPVEYQFSWGDGTYSSWGSPSRNSCSQSEAWTYAGTYQVRARARSKNNTGCVSDWSNALTVSVQGKPFIRVTSPNGGENLVVGTTYTITWDSLYLNSSGTIYLFYWFDGALHPITTLSSGATSFNWTIPRNPTGVTSPKPSGRIRSTSIWIGNWVNEGWECYDTSDQTFRILYDAWICKISGADQGGATLLFDQDSFEGYGISLGIGMFKIGGSYSVDAQGAMTGAYTIHDFANPATLLGSGNFTGSVDSSSKKLTLNLTTSNGTLSLSGARSLSDPEIPGNWAGTLSGKASGSFTPMAINPYELGDDLYSYVFEFSGAGSITEGNSISIEGYFYLTSTTTSRSNPTNVYGIYEMTGAINEIGVLTGVLNSTKGTISFAMTSENGNKYTLSGNAISTEGSRFFWRFSRK
jgi:Calx-beta domain